MSGRAQGPSKGAHTGTLNAAVAVAAAATVLTSGGETRPFSYPRSPALLISLRTLALVCCVVSLRAHVAWSPSCVAPRTLPRAPPVGALAANSADCPAAAKTCMEGLMAKAPAPPAVCADEKCNDEGGQQGGLLQAPPLLQERVRGPAQARAGQRVLRSVPMGQHHLQLGRLPRQGRRKMDSRASQPARTASLMNWPASQHDPGLAGRCVSTPAAAVLVLGGCPTPLADTMHSVGARSPSLRLPSPASLACRP